MAPSQPKDLSVLPTPTTSTTSTTTTNNNNINNNSINNNKVNSVQETEEKCKLEKEKDEHNFKIEQINESINDALKLLEESWDSADHLFDNYITRENALSTPISLRMPFIFYLGHLPSFAANTILNEHQTHIKTQCKRSNEQYDYLFSRGIDPDVDDPSMCHDHPEAPTEWPTWDQVIAYRDDVRMMIRNESDRGNISSSRLKLVAEHEFMHIETLNYMIIQSKRSRDISKCCSINKNIDMNKLIKVDMNEWCTIHNGNTSSGVANEKRKFLWDNELDTKMYNIKHFEIQKYAITINDYMKFIIDNGYNNESLWITKDYNDWTWLKENYKLQHPSTWECDSQVGYRILTRKNKQAWFECLNLPVSLCFAESRAYCLWKSRVDNLNLKVPSEHQWIRAAFGCVDEEQLKTKHQVRNEPFDVTDSNMNDTNITNGVVGMIGNGWELTRSLFEKFESFQAMKEYPEYSSDFFDGKHFVVRGGSWLTHPTLVRKSFRNFFQARYPYVLTKLRLVHEYCEHSES